MRRNTHSRGFVSVPSDDRLTSSDLADIKTFITEKPTMPPVMLARIWGISRGKATALINAHNTKG